MRESRSYGSVRGARGETRVPTATIEFAAVLSLLRHYSDESITAVYVRSLG